MLAGALLVAALALVLELLFAAAQRRAAGRIAATARADDAPGPPESPREKELV
jgi:hypothetical protein